MSTLLLGVGLVLCIEGLAFALAPGRLEEALRLLAAMSPENRRLIGLAALAAGVFVVWLSRSVS